MQQTRTTIVSSGRRGVLLCETFHTFHLLSLFCRLPNTNSNNKSAALAGSSQFFMVRVVCGGHMILHKKKCIRTGIANWRRARVGKN